jgi:2-alkyl-3-oxoalkanoate reductase
VILDAARKGFPAVIVRPMWIYGAKSTVTANLFRKIEQRKLPMVGAGRNTMQPVAIEDVVEAVQKCALMEGIEGRIFNIAGPEVLTIRSMCEMIAEAMGTTLPKLHVPMLAALPLARFCEYLCPIVGVTPPLTRQKLEFFRINNSYSIERARRELQWNPSIKFRQGARAIAEKLKAGSQTADARIRLS